MKHLAILSTALFFSSCIVFHTGGISSGPLLHATDKYVDMARGEAKSLFMFGLGDVNNDRLILQAKKDLYYKRPLQANEYYSNFTTDISKKSILLFVMINKVSVSADILKVNGDTSFVTFEPKFIRKITPYIEPKETLKPAGKSDARIRNTPMEGDSVYYSYNAKDYKLYVVTNPDKENVILKAVGANYKNVMVSATGSTLFFCNKVVGDHKQKDIVKVNYQDHVDYFPTKEEGVICGLTDDEALVRSKSGFGVYPISSLITK